MEIGLMLNLMISLNKAYVFYTSIYVSKMHSFDFHILMAFEVLPNESYQNKKVSKYLIIQNRACILISFKHMTFHCHVYVAGHYKHN